jgi:hypothetical protein
MGLIDKKSTFDRNRQGDIKEGNEATERTKRFQAESIALLKQLNVAVAASTPTAMIASIAYSGFDAVKADTHYGTKFR